MPVLPPGGRGGEQHLSPSQSPNAQEAPGAALGLEAGGPACPGLGWAQEEQRAGTSVAAGQRAARTTGARREGPGAEMRPAVDSRRVGPGGRSRRGGQGAPAPSPSWPCWGSRGTSAGRERVGPGGAAHGQERVGSGRRPYVESGRISGPGAQRRPQGRRVEVGRKERRGGAEGQGREVLPGRDRSQRGLVTVPGRQGSALCAGRQGRGRETGPDRRGPGGETSTGTRC